MPGILGRRRTAPGLLRRIDGRVEHLEPAFPFFITDDRHDEEIARPGRCDISKPDRFFAVALELLPGRFQEFDRRAAT